MYVYTVHIYTHILSIYVYVMEDITNTHIYIYSHPRHDLPRNILYIDVMRILQDIMGY